MATLWLELLLIISIFGYSPAYRILAALLGVAPIAICILILILETKKVYDPLALSRLLQLEVFTVPSLPTAVGNYTEAQRDAMIVNFIHKLDHIRFAYRKASCLLITSAAHADARSTLAAQLAARCASSGKLTLLVDADSGALTPLLSAPDGPGLSDWLKNEVTIEQAITAVQDGTFYLLRAGTPVGDIAAMLPDVKTKLFIAELRRLYDLIIIDSPPVLPDPAALAFCEHVDLVILSVRYGVSRYPLVATAKRMVGCAPAIGVVLNGCDSDANSPPSFLASTRQ